jgi:hypothetical protein
MTRGRESLAAVAVAAVAATGASRQAHPSLADVLDGATRYVAAYGEALATVVADERYVQTFDDAANGRHEVRTLSSEIALVRVQDRDEWVAFRDVLAVDGSSVNDRVHRLERLFLNHPDGVLARAQAIADESARYNLGPVVRNFNVPTAALFFLHPANRSRFRFRKLAERTRAAGPVWEIGYEERDRPTLIRTPTGRDVPARGTVLVEPGSGRVVETELGAREPDRNLDVRIVVTFAEAPGFDVLVPADMRETYEVAAGPRTTGFATYSNVRRFQVDVRIR